MMGINDVDLNNSENLISLLETAIVNARATLVDTICHHFSPKGTSIIAILRESHVALHIYPEHQAMFIDAFTCGTTADPENIISAFVEQLSPAYFEVQTIIRTSPQIKEKSS